MYIERVPNRNSPPAVLLRSSHWDHGKIRKVTHANLSKLPQPLVDGIALLLHGGTVVGPGSPAVRILDWLARRHLQDGCLALYDLTSVWYTGEHCELARRGYSRDGKRGSRQILVGLLCDAAGRPGRPVRDPGAGAARATGRRRGGARLQEPGRGRAGLPASQDRGPGTAPVLRAGSGPRAGAHAGVPAGLPPGMAPAAEAGAAAVRGAGPRRGRAAANGTELGKTKSGFSEDPPIR